MKNINFQIIKINLNGEYNQILWNSDEYDYWYRRILVTNQKVVGYNLQKKWLINKFNYVLKNSWYTGGLAIALNKEDKKLIVNRCKIMPEYINVYNKDGDAIADASIIFDNFVIIMRLTQKDII